MTDDPHRTPRKHHPAISAPVMPDLFKEMTVESVRYPLLSQIFRGCLFHRLPDSSTTLSCMLSLAGWWAIHSEGHFARVSSTGKRRLCTWRSTKGSQYSSGLGTR